jgi:hypothetical protein
MGWLTFFFVGGNPTFFIPLPALLFIYFTIYVVGVNFILKYTKTYNSKMVLVTFFESAAIYILLGCLLHL